MNAPLTPRNVSKRILRPEHPTKNQNTPPQKATCSSTAAHRLTGASARRKARTSHGVRSAQYDVEKAKARSRRAPVRYTIQTVSVPSQDVDVEMQDAPKPTVMSHSVTLPRALGQPARTEVAKEAVQAACGADYVGQTAEFIRDCLKEDARGIQLLRTNASVQCPHIPTTLPKELTITVSDPASSSGDNLPTHMLAVFAKPNPTSTPTSQKQRKAEIKLFPTHALVMASHCSKLPTNFFGSSPNIPSQSTTTTTPTLTTTPNGIATTIPVRPICLPHPPSFSALSQWMYTQRPESLYRAFLPNSILPPQSLLSNPTDPGAILAFATDLGRTYRPEILLEKAAMVHGLWMNACALGVFEDGVWEVVDSCWEVLLRALAVGTGTGDVDVSESA